MTGYISVLGSTSTLPCSACTFHPGHHHGAANKASMNLSTVPTSFSTCGILDWSRFHYGPANLMRYAPVLPINSVATAAPSMHIGAPDTSLFNKSAPSVPGLLFVDDGLCLDSIAKRGWFNNTVQGEKQLEALHSSYGNEQVIPDPQLSLTMNPLSPIFASVHGEEHFSHGSSIASGSSPSGVDMALITTHDHNTLGSQRQLRARAQPCKRRFPCPYPPCQRVFGSRNDLERHLATRQHRKDVKSSERANRFRCKYLWCKRNQQGFSRKDHFMRHMERMHQGILSDNSEE